MPFSYYFISWLGFDGDLGEQHQGPLSMNKIRSSSVLSCGLNFGKYIYFFLFNIWAIYGRVVILTCMKVQVAV